MTKIYAEILYAGAFKNHTQAYPSVWGGFLEGPSVQEVDADRVRKSLSLGYSYGQGGGWILAFPD